MRGGDSKKNSAFTYFHAWWAVGCLVLVKLIKRRHWGQQVEVALNGHVASLLGEQHRILTSSSKQATTTEEVQGKGVGEARERFHTCNGAVLAIQACKYPGLSLGRCQGR